ncbi:hypothetical protein [Pseudomonas koreensis]|uniref:Uncharacterized protein n=1 Tax=Pseudomonas koreensis TaxID=198620 RepID=A0A9X2XEB1_9PSED|nr:hypothetical protein [Pseudomonas koreensis]MCU7246912.1 hypothetical protein [Pseudomonas koreensis]
MTSDKLKATTGVMANGLDGSFLFERLPRKKEMLEKAFWGEHPLLPSKFHVAELPVLDFLQRLGEVAPRADTLERLLFITEFLLDGGVDMLSPYMGGVENRRPFGQGNHCSPIEMGWPV